MNIIEKIRKRKSIRSYEYSKLSDSDLELINEIILKEYKTPFGGKAEFSIIEKNDAVKNEKVKLGTYGFIYNARYFIAGKMKRDKFSEFDYGFLLEKIILDLTANNFGTCWVGGTFKRNDYNKLLKPNEDEYVPGITPVGYPAEKKSFLERIGVLKSNQGNRKDFEKLFFDKSTDIPLQYISDCPYCEALEMVRLAPSAVNRQAWRVVRNENEFHFYIKRNKAVSFSQSVDLQKIDLGIAMCHFYFTLNHFGINGTWEQKNIASPELEYVVSFAIER